ncbi:DNA invertase Pin-like site-specific DNA recombinase [Desulfohalotomaculum tongense]|uniref:recombinase family protein n=1 Tax=Desulforadius tongensis TaxID=1216062 RepID=UPI00195C5E94|nr:recombinase family protein [Desulforadius tongensis]MBM7855881.1 DNA invertase Pin-like site-specific DNA recombinase [Desulforadius tongensis]
MKAVIYARFSSDNQREENITAQVRACTEYASRKGCTVVKVYTDEARSATTDDRPSFLEMIDQIKTKLIKTDIVLVHKLDRVARNRYDSAFYKRELRQAGVRVESVLEHLDDSPESILMESVIEGMAEYYSRNLARDVMKGMKETTLQGKHTGGKPPLGYDVDSEGKYIINETEARAVKIIFEMYSAGCGYNAILARLNTHGYKTKASKPFGKNSLHGILRNKKYIGIYVFNRTAAKQGGKRNHHLSKPLEEIIELSDAIPPIIDEETFRSVQERMDANRQGPARSKAKVNYLLSGLIWCGECNHKMTGASSSYLTKKVKNINRDIIILAISVTEPNNVITKKLIRNLLNHTS